jgi:hypothetical protein
MRLYTVQTRPGRPPALVREGFSWLALLFGPFWLLAHRAWIAGVLALCVGAAVTLLVPAAQAGAVDLVLAWVLGVFGNDLRRWSLARAGYELATVVAARDEDEALARLLDRRPDLVADALGMQASA